MLKDMLLPSTINEAILSMSDAECRDTLYRADLKITNVEFWQPKCRGKCKKKAMRKGSNNSGKEERKTENWGGKCKNEYSTQLVGVHRQRALENGHFRKDRHRSFRIAVYMTRKRTQTI